MGVFLTKYNSQAPLECPAKGPAERCSFFGRLPPRVPRNFLGEGRGGRLIGRAFFPRERSNPRALVDRKAGLRAAEALFQGLDVRCPSPC
jgi:hypothetical protein